MRECQRRRRSGLAADLHVDRLYEESLRDGQIRLGYGNHQDFSQCNDLAAVLAKIQEKEPSATEKDYNVLSVHLLKNKMRDGDLVIISDGNRKFRAIGRINGKYKRIAGEHYDQVRPVQWLLKLPDSRSTDVIMRKQFSQRTLYRLREDVLKVEALTHLLSGEKSARPDKCVLIIDEINRGNISKIFGELITLIEPDKRLGQMHELRVRLPHSAEPFGVPANVYIVGTMNTADRSIAFLDTALRRRFRFKEMMPDAEVIRRHVGRNGVVEGIDVAALLETLNQRIELLFDRDHKIGHSYFLNVRSLSDLGEVLRAQVFPLLQEYFHDDWGKICVVLGCPYDADSGDRQFSTKMPFICRDSGDAESLISTDGFEARPRYWVNSAVGTDDEAIAALFAGILQGGVNPRNDLEGADKSDEE